MDAPSAASSILNSMTDDSRSRSSHQGSSSVVQDLPILRTKSQRDRWMPLEGSATTGNPAITTALLANQYSSARKWTIALVISCVQISMNMNTSIYSNAITGVMDEFHVSAQTFRVGAAVFLIMYAIGSLLWAPWSEELGRKPVLQLSLFLVNVFQLPCALAPNFSNLVVGRFFGGLFSAGGSVTLGTIADLWDADEQQIPVVVVIFFSVFGASIGPIPGAFVQQYLNWRWVFWIQLIVGGFVQVLHFFIVPETRSTVVLENAAKKLRKEGRDKEADAIVVEKPALDVQHVITIWRRPFEMFIREPIVLLLSLLSGFSDALVFTFIEAFNKLFSQWSFTTVDIGLAFIPVIVGYVVAALSYIIFPIRRDNKIRRRTCSQGLAPESRLWWLLFLGPLLPIGLFGVAWTSFGPPTTPWIAPMIFIGLFGIANYAIYMSSIDYMVASYGPFSSSATAGNALARDGLAGAASLFAMPMYNKLGLQWGTTLLAFAAVFVTIPIYVFYWKGPEIRARSRFALSLAGERQDRGASCERSEGSSYLRSMSTPHRIDV